MHQLTHHHLHVPSQVQCPRLPKRPSDLGCGLLLGKPQDSWGRRCHGWGFLLGHQAYTDQTRCLYHLAVAVAEVALGMLMGVPLGLVWEAQKS
jgi:hypothetical protein